MNTNPSVQGLPQVALDDPFRPPANPCRVRCLHCHSVYDSAAIRWDGNVWACPVPGCDGLGFGFDIHRIEPEEASSRA